MHSGVAGVVLLGFPASYYRILCSTKSKELLAQLLDKIDQSASVESLVDKDFEPIVRRSNLLLLGQAGPGDPGLLALEGDPAPVVRPHPFEESVALQVLQLSGDSAAGRAHGDARALFVVPSAVMHACHLAVPCLNGKLDAPSSANLS